MKKLIIVLLIIALSTPCFASNAPPEFAPINEGAGLRVLIIDDFNGYWDTDHGNKMTWIFYDNLPMLEITQLDFLEASDFEIDEPYDLVVCFFYPPTEEMALEYMSEDILAVKSISIAPAGNNTKTWYCDNAMDKWFITVGASGHPEWRQGEVTWEEDEAFGGSCGACAMFGVTILKNMIEGELND